MSEEIYKANNIAMQVALAEMLRIVVANVCADADLSVAKAKLAKFEEIVVSGINSIRHFPEANDATETYIREAAAGYVSRFVGSINAK